MSSLALSDEGTRDEVEATRAALIADRGRPRRAIEFLLTGGATLLLLPLCWLLRRGVGLDSAELAVGFITFYGAHVINDPHFVVTYLLFYRSFRARAFSRQTPRMLRLRYLAAGLLAPLLLLSWAAWALAAASAASLGAMTQLMFLLVGWHYVKQSFGVVIALSRRRGTSFSILERRALLAHCYAAWFFGWATPFEPGRLVEEKGVVYRTLTHPGWLEPATRGAFWLSLVVVLSLLAAKWFREGRLPFSPLLGFFSAVWLWTVWSGVDPVFMYFIPALHSIQYLYFVGLMKGNQAHAHEGPPDFGRPPRAVLGALAAVSIALGAVVFHLLPSGLDETLVSRNAASSDLGPTPFFAAIFTFVNLHHYLMDAVIWRRDNPETRYLHAPP